MMEGDGPTYSRKGSESIPIFRRSRFEDRLYVFGLGGEDAGRQAAKSCLFLPY